MQSTNVTCELYAGCLHAKAYSEIGNSLLACIANRVQHAGDTTFTKSAGDKNPIVAFELRLVRAILGIATLEPLSLHPSDIQLQTLPDRRVNQSLFERLIRVFVFDVLSDDCNRNFIFWVIYAVNQTFPRFKLACGSLEMQILQGQRVDFLVCEYEWDFVRPSR